MDTLKHLLYDYFITLGLEETMAKYLNMLALLIALLIIAFIAGFVVRKILLTIFTRFASKTKSNFDDILIANKAPRNIAYIIPFLIALEFVPIVFADFKYFGNIVEKGLQVFAILLFLWIVRSILNTLKDYFKTLPRLKDKPIDSYIQVFMIFAWV